MRLQIRDLSTGYGKRGKSVEISAGVCVDIHGGSLVSLLGRNGGGKSTLLKTVAGFIKPLGGTVEIDGKDINLISTLERSHLISVVLTGRLINLSATVRETVGYGRSPYTGRWGVLGREDEKIVNRSLERSGVLALADRQVCSLSDGEYQKVMIAKALAQDTPVILLDEPSAFLDFPSKVELMILLKSLAKDEGKIIIQSSHDLNIALGLSTHLLLLDKSIGYSFGETPALLESGEVEKYFTAPEIHLDKSAGLFRIK